MEKTKEKFFNKDMVLFLLIGAGNALLTMLLMYGMYEFLHLGYWFSSASAFAICSVISFVLNKKYTFRNEDSALKTGIKFTIVIVLCYTLAYGVAKPLTSNFFNIIETEISNENIERIALLVGQIVFTAMNYLGQRFFAFAKSRHHDK